MKNIVYACLLFSMFFSCMVRAADNFDQALSRAVVGDRVNYQVLCQDTDFNAYLNELRHRDPTIITVKQDRLAFWINVYNASNAAIVCKHYPIKNLNQLHKGGLVWAALRKKTIWDKPINVGGKTYTLKQVEHEIIKREFNEPLSQFALYCGSIFCPSLRKEAYYGDKLNEQLSDQARIFFANTSINQFDLSKRRAMISPILNWNEKSFGRNTQEMLLLVADYLPEAIRDDIRNNVKLWKVTYSPYDLIVNDVENTKEN